RAPALQAGGHRFDPVQLHQLVGCCGSGSSLKKRFWLVPKAGNCLVLVCCLSLLIGCELDHWSGLSNTPVALRRLSVMGSNTALRVARWAVDLWSRLRRSAELSQNRLAQSAGG